MGEQDASTTAMRAAMRPRCINLIPVGPNHCRAPLVGSRRVHRPSVRRPPESVNLPKGRNLNIVQGTKRTKKQGHEEYGGGAAPCTGAAPPTFLLYRQPRREAQRLGHP